MPCNNSFCISSGINVRLPSGFPYSLLMSQAVLPPAPLHEDLTYACVAWGQRWLWLVPHVWQGKLYEILTIWIFPYSILLYYSVLALRLLWATVIWLEWTLLQIIKAQRCWTVQPSLVSWHSLLCPSALIKTFLDRQIYIFVGWSI